MKTFKLDDIKPQSLVFFKKHNGKGKPITYRTIFVSFVNKNSKGVGIAYDTFNGSNFATLLESEYGKEFEILDIKYFTEK